MLIVKETKLGYRDGYCISDMIARCIWRVMSVCISLCGYFIFSLSNQLPFCILMFCTLLIMQLTRTFATASGQKEEKVKVLYFPGDISLLFSDCWWRIILCIRNVF